MSNFELIDSKIFKIEKENNNLIVKFYLNVKMYDYVADENNKVVRGNKNRKIDISYEITYIKSLEEKQDVCPNCNAPITNNSSNKCEYCNSIIVKDSSEWVMSKKQNVGQR
jgi:uncharacterized protein with PIN domain